MAGIAILGAGIFATEQHLPALIAAHADIKAIYSRSAATASTLHTKALKTYPNISLYSDDSPSTSNLSALLSRPDVHAVVIVLPIPIQPTIIRRCLAAGKHVLAEKPIAADVATARALIEEYNGEFKPKGLVFSIAEQFRYMEAHDLARSWIVEERVLGRLVQVHMRVWGDVQAGMRYFETAWRKTPEYQGGWVLDGGVHHVALVRYVSGEEIVETRGFARQVAEHLPPLDTVNAAVLLSGGATGTISMSFASKRKANEYLFVGEKGSLSMSMGSEGTVLKLELEDGEGESREETVKSRGVPNEIEAFLEAVKTGKAEGKAGPEEALNDVALIESLCKEGGRVENWK